MRLQVLLLSVFLSFSLGYFAQSAAEEPDVEWDMDDWPEEDELPYHFNGVVEVAAGFRIANDALISTDKTLADVRTQFQFDYDFEQSRFALNADLYYDGVLDQTRLQMREAAWQGGLGMLGEWGKHFDLKIGQQVLTWGTGDYIFLNDLFPKDYQSFFAGRDDEYLKAPSLSAKLSGFFDTVNIDFVVTPEFTPDVYINGDYFSFFLPFAGKQVAPGFDVSVPLRPQSPEYALRLYKTIGASEIAFYIYDGFHKTPNSFTEELLPTFSGLSVYGASLITNVGPGLFNSEVAYYESKDDVEGNNPFVPNSQARYLVGYEQEIIKNLTGSVQGYLERKQDHDDLIQNSLAPEFEVDRSRVWFTQRLRYRALQQTLTLNLFNFYSTSDKEGYVKLSADYSPVDAWRLTVGTNVFYGDEPFTFFAQFEDASNVFTRFRYFY